MLYTHTHTHIYICLYIVFPFLFFFVLCSDGRRSSDASLTVAYEYVTYFICLCEGCITILNSAEHLVFKFYTYT